MMNAPAFRILLPQHVAPLDALPVGEVYQLAGRCMGTRWQVRLIIQDGRSPERLQADIASILERIESQMSHFREDSPLRRFASLPAGEWSELPEEFAHVMRAALETAHASDGAFDPALATAIDAWGFGAARNFSETGFTPPSQGDPSRAAWRELVLDEAGRLRQPGGVALNLAAIAKGFAVDAVSGFLSQSGLCHHLVEVGGELRGAGIKPDGQPWWVALEAPDAACPLPATRIALYGLAVATSGDYRRRYHSDGQRLQHTLDPRTGAPVAHTLASVTIVHESCMYADAWATAIMVLGPQDGLALAERHGLRALLQWRDAQGNWCEAPSSAFRALEQ